MAKLQRVDLNTDMGESFGPWTLGDDAAGAALTARTWPAASTRATSLVMDAPVALCPRPAWPWAPSPATPISRALAAAAPPDPAPRSSRWSSTRLAPSTGFCRGRRRATHVKPHGALYNQAAEDAALRTRHCLRRRSLQPRDPAGRRWPGRCRRCRRRRRRRPTPGARGLRRPPYKADGTLEPRLRRLATHRPAEAAAQVMPSSRRAPSSRHDGTPCPSRPPALLPRRHAGRAAHRGGRPRAPGRRAG